MNSADTGSDKARTTKLTQWLQSWSQDLRARALAICLAVGLLAGLLQIFHVGGIYDFLKAQELGVEDRFFAWREKLYGRSPVLSDEIILVCVDSESARRLNLKPDEPWPRKTYALLLEKLANAGAEVIGLNVPLAGPSTVKAASEADSGESKKSEEDKLSADDAALADRLSQLHNVVLASHVDTETRARSAVFRPPYKAFLEALGVESGSIGNALIVPYSDGQVRFAPLVFDQFAPNAFFYKSFALRLAEKQLGALALPDSPERVCLKKHVYPRDIRINYLGPSGTFKMIPLWRALEWQKHYARNGLFLPGLQTESEPETGAENSSNASGNSSDKNQSRAQNPFQNKIVLVGLVENAAENKAPYPQAAEDRALGDSYLTPSSAAPMSAIEVEANVLSNLLHDRFLIQPELWSLLLTIAAISLLFGKLLGRLHQRQWLGAMLVTAFALFWTVGSFLCFAYLHTLIPVVVPIAGVLVPAWMLVVLDAESFARREKRRRTRVFRTLAAKPLAREIERKLLAELGLEGKRMVVTVMACQLRKFIDDRHDEPAEAIMERLNSCLSIMMSCIGEHHGLVERIWNCGVIGIWGAPINMDEDKQVKMAAECALAIRKRLFDYRDGKDTDAGLSFYFTCGINTGDAVCGTINALSKDSSLTQYGALGPAVDLAVDLDALNTTYGTTFMLGSASATLVSDQFEVREIDRLKLGQRDGLQSIYELLPWEGSLPGALEEAMALFKQGRVALEEGRVQEAEQLFATSLRMVPHDRPTTLMLDRCRDLLAKSPTAHELMREKPLSLKERLSGSEGN